MALSSRKRNWLFILLGAFTLVVLAPTLFYFHVRSKIDTKFHEELGETATYEDLSISIAPAAATFSKVSVGGSRKTTASPSLIDIDTVHVDSTLESILGSVPEWKALIIKGVRVNIAVDEKGGSSFAHFIREMPLSKRGEQLPIEVLRLENITISTFVAPALSKVTLAAGIPDSVLKIATVNARDFVLPKPGAMLGKEQWTPVSIDAIEASTGAVPPCIRFGKISFELAQAATKDVPVRIRKFKAEGADAMTVYTQAGVPPGIDRVILATEQGFGVKESPEVHESGKTSTPGGTGLLIEDLVADGRMEVQGPNASGQVTFWRLEQIKLDAKNLAFGPEVTSKEPGLVKMESTTASSSGPGHFALAVTDIQGGYPQNSFKAAYRVDNLAASPFSVMAEDESHPGVQSGSLTLVFDGGADQGQLNFQGSVKLSDDFQMSGEKSLEILKKIQRGIEIRPVTITGTMEHPTLSLPPELVFMNNLLSVTIVSGPLGVVDSVFGKTIVGSIIAESIKLPVKAGTSVMRKVPVVGKLFGGDKGDKEVKDDKTELR